jgi:capsular polysaccharide biosynthesis protein
MNTNINANTEDEIELIDVWRFIQRQQKLMVTVFLFTVAIALLFAITRPTTWQSHTSLIVGERFFFLQQQQQQQQQQQLIESIDELKYKFQSSVAITPIKNTRIIELSATDVSKEAALTQLKKTTESIIASHQQILDAKKNEFVKLLSAISRDDASKTEMMRLLDNASNSSMTKQFSEVSIEEKQYSGLLIKATSIGLFVGLVLAVAIGLVKDYLDRNAVK